EPHRQVRLHRGRPAVRAAVYYDPQRQPRRTVPRRGRGKRYHPDHRVVPAAERRECGCMMTSTLRNQINKLWTEFWTGGITNPLTVIEQISFRMFARLLDIAEIRAEKRASRLSKPFKGQF